MMLAALVSLPLTLGIPECRDLERRGPAAEAAPERVGTIRNAAWLALRTYQIVVSPADGAGCSMYPSCSSYAIRAVRDTGPVLGGWLAAGRILRNHRDEAYPVCRAGGRLYRYNPPEDDAWWRSSR